MDCLSSSTLQIVLGIKEGSGFGFSSYPLVVVAGLNNNKLETDPIPPSTDPHFDTELAWETDKKFFRRLRTANTPLKIECFTVVNQQKREKLGYVLLNLKQAQIIPRGSQINLLECWYRLLGIRTEAKAHNPEILLSLRVEEAYLDKIESLRPSTTDHLKDVNINSQPQPVPSRTLDQTSKNQDFIQIGPADQCTQVFELSIHIAAFISNTPHQFSNLPPLKLNFSIFGSSYTTKNLLQSPDSIDTINISLRTKLQLLYAYFKEFPTLNFKILNGDETFGTSSMELKELVPAHNLSSVLNDCVKIDSKVQVRLNIEGITALSNFINDAALKPFIDITVRLIYKGELSTNGENIIRCETIPVLPSEDSKCEKSIQMNRDSALCTLTNSPSRSPIHSARNTEKPVSELIQKDLPTSGIYTATSEEYMLMKEEIHMQADTDMLPLEKKSESALASHVMLNHKEYARETALRICEELEDWKEQQQEMFKFELKKKSERHMEKLSSEWLKRQKEIEEDFLKRMEQCRELTESLSQASKELASRTDLVVQRENELAVAKEELERQYTQKFQELREASRRHQADMEHQIKLSQSEKIELITRIEVLEEEKKRLQEALIECQSCDSQLTSEQTANLITDMKCLEEKLEAALDSKTFFKEQWAIAVREIHRLKEEQQQQIKLELKKNRNDLQRLGLVEVISQEENEMRADQTAIKNLRSQLLEFQTINKDGDTLKTF